MNALPLRAHLARAAELTDGGGHYRNGYDFVVREGRDYLPQPLPPAYPSLSPRSCYFNALLMAIERGLPYIEGYAIAFRGGPVLSHAWNADALDRAIDTTWSGRGAGVAYLGVPFSASRADEATWDEDACVIEDPRGLLLGEPWPGEDSPGDTTGLLEKMARQAFEWKPFRTDEVHASVDELLDHFRRMAASR